MLDPIVYLDSPTLQVLAGQSYFAAGPSAPLLYGDGGKAQSSMPCMVHPQSQSQWVHHTEGKVHPAFLLETAPSVSRTVYISDLDPQVGKGCPEATPRLASAQHV
jgi:hypothetical protein